MKCSTPLTTVYVLTGSVGNTSAGSDALGGADDGAGDTEGVGDAVLALGATLRHVVGEMLRMLTFCHAT